MRMAYVITRADAVGGASVHVRDLAVAMAARGHEVTVLVGGEGQVTAQLRAAGVRVHPLRYLQRALHPAHDLHGYLELLRTLQAFRPELVSAHTAKAGFLARAACRKLGIPAIYTPHGLSVGSRISAVAGRVFGVAERMAARWSAAIVCVCEAEKRLALAHGIGPETKLHVIYNAMPDVPEGLRATPGLEPPRLCCVARFEPPKDHDTLLRGLALLRGLPWTLDLVGDGPRLEAIRHLAAELGLQDRVRFLGYQADAAPVLAEAQIFLLASRSEAFPRSILEGMRAGLPIAASAVGGVAEAVESGANGVLIPPGNAAAWAREIRPMLESKALRERFGNRSRQVYCQRFLFERMVEETAGLYRTVLPLAGTQKA